MWTEREDSPEDEGYRRRLSAGGLARRLLPYLRAHAGALATGLALLGLSVGSELAAPLVLRALVDGPAVRGDAQGLVGHAALFLGIVALGMAAAWLEVVVVARVGLSVVNRLKREVFEHLLTLSMDYFDAHAPGRLLARVESDTERLRQLFSEVALALLGSAALLVGTLAVLLATDARVTLAVLTMALPLLAALPWALGLVRRLSAEARRRYARLSAFITEYIRGVEVIQAFGYAPRARERLAGLNRSKAEGEIRAELVSYGYFGILVAFEVVAVAAVLWMGMGRQGMGAAGGLAGMSTGTLVLFIEYARRVFVPIRAFSEQVAFVQRAFASADRVVSVLDTVTRTPDRPGARPVVPRDWRTISLESVGFGYDGALAPALDSLSFTLRRGERLALVGPSGGGKTTIAALLLRLYEPASGRISLDGVDLRDYALAAWRRCVGLVPQDIHLFPGTLGENLRALRDDVPEEAVRRALVAAQAEELERRIPGGLEGVLAEGGGNLSMGERQLVSFARAVVDGPDLLVLDEATSSVDPATEQRVQRSLERVLEGRTSITIAHRLATVRRADRILVIGAGRVMEEGTHDALHRAGGIYRDLYERQFRPMERDAVASS